MYLNYFKVDEFRVTHKEADSEGILPRFLNTIQTVEGERRGSSFNMEEALDILVEDEFRVIFEELDSEENLPRFVITTQVVDVKRMSSIIISIKFGEDCAKK